MHHYMKILIELVPGKKCRYKISWKLLWKWKPLFNNDKLQPITYAKHLGKQTWFLKNPKI